MRNAAHAHGAGNLRHHTLDSALKRLEVPKPYAGERGLVAPRLLSTSYTGPGARLGRSRSRSEVPKCMVGARETVAV